MAEAAMRLFACNGIDSVSLREIATASGQKNTNAVRYHFKDKNGLIEWIFHEHMVLFEFIRGEMINIAKSEKRLSDPSVILRIILLPYISVRDCGGTYIYAGFMAQYMMRPNNSSTKSNQMNMVAVAPNLNFVLSILRDELSFLTDDVFWARLRAAIRSFCSSIARWDRERAMGSTSMSFETLVADSVCQVAAGLTCSSGYDRIHGRLIGEVTSAASRT